MVWNFTYTTLVIKLTCHSDQFFHFSHCEEFHGFEIFKAFLEIDLYIQGLARSLDKIGLPFQVEYSRFVQWRFLEHSACNLFLGRNPAKT